MDRLRLDPERVAAQTLMRGAMYSPALAEPREIAADVAHDHAARSLSAARRQALGLFLRHLARGERIAHAVTKRQAAIALDARSARFFRSQSRHELLHALVFDACAARFAAPPLALSPCPYAEYETRLFTAAARGDFPETVIGTQIVLEALGEVLLARLERGLVRHGTGLVRLRRMILAQEAAHHAFGCALVAALLAAGTLTARSLRERALPYRELAQRMIAAASPALHHFALTPDDIARDFAAQLEHTGFA